MCVSVGTIETRTTVVASIREGEGRRLKVLCRTFFLFDGFRERQQLTKAVSTTLKKGRFTGGRGREEGKLNHLHWPSFESSATSNLEKRSQI